MAAYNDNPDSLSLLPSAPAIGTRVSRKFIQRISDAQRKQAMQAAWQAYLGMLPPALKVEPGEYDLNVNVNRLAPVVDTGIAWLFGNALGIEIDPNQPLFALPGQDGGPDDPDRALDMAADTDSDEATGNLIPQAVVAGAPTERNPKLDEAQDYLDGCWGDEDERMTLLSKLAMNGGNCGHLFAKILPPDPQSGRQFPRLIVLDPQNVTIDTDPEDSETVRCYHISYDAEADDGTAIQKRQVIARQDNGAGTADDCWTITNYAKSSEGSEWIPLGQPVLWRHPWPPIVDGPNLPLPNQRWGQPDITPSLIGLNKAINFVASNINAVGYSHGHPWIFASGTDAEILNIAPGRVISIPHPDGKLDAINASGDIAGLMQFEADLRSDMDEQSKVPGVATGRIGELPRGQISGVTIRMLYMPLVFRTTFKRRTYGKFIREANARMLALGGYGDGTDLGGVKTLLHWQDPLPTDDLQQAQAAFQWSQMGVSNDTLMSKGGFDPDVERRKNEEANMRQLTAFSQGRGMPPEPPEPPETPDASTEPTEPVAAAADKPSEPSEPAPAVTPKQPAKKRASRKRTPPAAQTTGTAP